MPSYNSKMAKDILTEAEKERFIALFLNSSADNSTINWAKASEEYGSKSVESMRVMLRKTYKKLDVAGANTAAAATSSDPATPAKANKRKATKEETEEDEEDTKPKKTPAQKAKKAKAETEVKAEEE